MSLALYRKYRPGTFAEVKGQEHVTEPLRQALRMGRINHAYLFSGPRGCGKTSSARILARSLNCEKGPTPDPCGECESCVALAATGPGHLDVIEIDAASHGGVDDARDLRERAFFAPVSARYKIYIIDEAHMVTREGFNALLKLVEEPPPHLKFIFATTEPEKVIGTIKSRTHHYPFRLMPPATLRALLEEILGSESVPYEPTALPLVVRAGAGSARDSLSILDQLLAGAEDDGITYAKAVSLLGYTDGDLLDEIVNAFAQHDGAKVFGAVNRVIEGGHDPRRFAADLLERFRDLVILANVPEAATSGLLDRPADELERLVAQAASMGPAELTRAAEVFNAGLTEMRGATSPRLLLELMCARVLLPGATAGEEALLARLERLERGGVVAQMAARASSGTAGHSSPVAHGGQAGGTGGAPAPVSAGQGHGAGPGDPVAAGHGAGGQAGQSGAAAHAGSAAQGGPGGPGGSAGQGGSAAHAGPAAQGGAAGAGAGGADGDWPEAVRPGAGGSAGMAGGSGGVPGPGGVAGGSAGGPVGAGGAVSGSGGVDSGGMGAGPVAAGGAGAIQSQWPAVLAALKQRSIVVWANVSTNAQVVGVEGNIVTLGFAQVGAMKNFTGGGKDAVVASALGDVLGGKWRVEAVVGGSPAPGGRGPQPGPQGGHPGPPAGNPGPQGGNYGPQGGNQGPEGGSGGPQGNQGPQSGTGHQGPQGGGAGPQGGAQAPQGGQPGTPVAQGVGAQDGRAGAQEGGPASPSGAQHGGPAQAAQGQSGSDGQDGAAVAQNDLAATSPTGQAADGQGAAARTTTDESWPDAPDDMSPGTPPMPDPGQTATIKPGQATTLKTGGLAAARSAAQAAAQSGPRAPKPRQGGASAWPDAVPGRNKGADSDDVDPLNDADADIDAVGGMALLQRELGAQVIGEIDHT
ncbi:DNA polymerase III subunit gamma and tau [Nonomuraea sp. NPDC050790]|uniref:DNA polymerase III subunit gamma and tau n=1 Tax=Nonomuraea sp. NPDC050790 TaxID=3364371 RepID=UPI003787F08B